MAWVQKAEVVRWAPFANRLSVPSQRHAGRGSREMLHGFHWDDSKGRAHPCHRTLECRGLNKCKLPPSQSHLTPWQRSRRSGRSGGAYVVSLAAPLHGELQNILSFDTGLGQTSLLKTFNLNVVHLEWMDGWMDVLRLPNRHREVVCL